jgi:hypothetical protein
VAKVTKYRNKHVDASHDQPGGPWEAKLKAWDREFVTNLQFTLFDLIFGIHDSHDRWISMIQIFHFL